MAALLDRLRMLDAATRASAITDAAAALDAGRLVVLPTESVYVVAGAGWSPRGVAALGRVRSALFGGSPPWPAWWLAPDVDSLEAAVEFARASHRRLVHRLAPGPAVFIAEVGEDAAAEARGRVGAAPGVIDDGGRVAFRVPSSVNAWSLAQQAKGPIVAEELADDSGDRARTAREAASILGRLGEGGGADSVAAILDAGAAELGKPSTVLGLKRPGGWEVLRQGAYEERFISKRLQRTILFVCTGNTCRSPMAEAIARHLLDRAGESDQTTHVASAGVGAGPGLPASPEAVAALEAMGIAPPAGRSKALSRQMIDEADAIFVMTRGHKNSVLSIDPSADGKVFLLDPAGKDVPDPIGMPLDAYAAAAERIRSHLTRRLKELST